MAGPLTLPILVSFVPTLNRKALKARFVDALDVNDNDLVIAV